MRLPVLYHDSQILLDFLVQLLALVLCFVVAREAEKASAKAFQMFGVQVRFRDPMKLSALLCGDLKFC
jgi:hypothetical protein